MVQERHVIVHDDDRGRIVYMDSITHANEKYGPDDVLIGGSWMGVVTVSFAAPLKPKAIICNDAGVGLNGGGINGLYYLDGLYIPAAAAAANSCEIANGQSHWETGVVSHVNHWARACGCEPGMSVQEAARAMLNWSDAVREAAPGRDSRHTVYDADDGQIVTVDSIKFVVPEDRDKVVIIGSHGGVTTCGYAAPVSPRGVITNDGGGGRDGAGTRGLKLLNDTGIPAAGVAVHSASIGDGYGMYQYGIISTVNEAAAALGARPGMRTRDVADLFLRGA